MNTQSEIWSKDNWSELLEELKKFAEAMDEAWPVCVGVAFLFFRNLLRDLGMRDGITKYYVIL